METRLAGSVLRRTEPLKTPPTTAVFIQGIQGVEMRVLEYPEWKHAWWLAFLSIIEPLKTPPTTHVFIQGIQGVVMQLPEYHEWKHDWRLAF